MKAICLFTGLLFCFPALAQELPVTTRQQLEQWAEAAEQEPEDDALLLQLTSWRRRPLNLNNADADDLRLFPFLSALQIHHFLAYRAMLGPLVAVHELQSIPGWDVVTIRNLLPYVVVAEPMFFSKNLKSRMRGGAQYLLLRNSRVLQKAKGFDKSLENGFAGDRNHLLLRYRYQHPQGLQWGITADKDAGEKFFIKRPADFFSLHFFARRLGSIKALALGDFTVNMGQGLVHWQSLAFGKSAEVLSIKRQSPVLRPYTSAGEALFLRGGGITMQHRKLEATVFGALQKVAANLDVDSAGAAVITSFNISGLHRTAAEMADRKAAGQRVAGANITYRKHNGHLSLNAVHYNFSLPVQKRAELYNFYAPSGKSFFNASADYSYTLRNMHLFGEWATDKAGRGAWVQGLLVSTDPKVDLALHTRIIHRGYTAMAANAFAESSTTVNEHGIYLGAQVRPSATISISAYADIFRAPWLRYRVDAPASGKDYLLQAQYQPTKGSLFYARFRSEQKEENISETGMAVQKLAFRNRKNLRLYGNFAVHNNLTLRSQAETVWSQKGSEQEQGWLLFTDAQLQPFKKWSADLRLAVFKTDGYNSRIYAFENDVLFSFSVPALWGRGLRSYALLRYRPNQNLHFWLRLAHLVYGHQNSIGSGMDAVAGNQRTDIRFQAMVEW